MDLNRLLQTDVRDFITTNENKDPHQLMLQARKWPDLPMRDIVYQIQSRKKAKKKLPSWYINEQIIFPREEYLQQSSSEITARFKSNLIEGQKLVDLTGGTGVDTEQFADKFDEVAYNEPNPELLELAEHNFHVLGRKNVTFSNLDCDSFLVRFEGQVDWFYADPLQKGLRSKGF